MPFERIRPSLRRISAPATPQMLELEEIRVRYGRLTAIDRLSLNVQEGELVGLIGPNGAGKSTTLLSIMGSVRLAAGVVRFEGSSLSGLAPEEVVRLGIGLVPEGRHILASLTVAENLEVGMTPVWLCPLRRAQQSSVPPAFRCG